MDDADIEWIRKKLWEEICLTYHSSDEEFKKRSLERHVRSMLRRIEEDKPPDIRAYVEKEQMKDGYSERISRISSDRKLTHLEKRDVKELDRLEKELAGIEKEISEKHPEFMGDLRRYITFARNLIISKRTGRQVEAS